MENKAVKEYLESMCALREMNKLCLKGYTYSCFEQYVLKNGKPYSSKHLTAPELVYLQGLVDAYGEGFPIKQCFYNSQKFLLDTEYYQDPDTFDLKYVEGYCLSIIPFLHGWLELNGKVVDFTLRARDPEKCYHRRLLPDRVLGEFTHRQYYGVSFNLEDVKSFVQRTQSGASMLDNYREGFPLLK